MVEPLTVPPVGARVFLPLEGDHAIVTGPLVQSDWGPLITVQVDGTPEFKIAPWHCRVVPERRALRLAAVDGVAV